MTSQIKVSVKCPSCGKSLMNSEIQIDDLPSIGIAAKVGGKSGRVYLSQIYGSYNKKFEGVEDIPESVVDCSCPRCRKPFPIQKVCECNAPVATLNLEIGGTVNFCTRNGCSHHSVEFENLNDAFLLFQHQDETHYM
ncbi:MAG: hypothetical protein R2941_13525 [Desulfobacterales bacterium]